MQHYFVSPQLVRLLLLLLLALLWLLLALLLLLLLMLPVLPLMSLLLLPVLQLVLLLLRRGQAVQHSSVAMVPLTRRQSTTATLPGRSKSPTWPILLLLLLVLLWRQIVQHCPLSMNPILAMDSICLTTARPLRVLRYRVSNYSSSKTKCGTGGSREPSPAKPSPAQPRLAQLAHFSDFKISLLWTSCLFCDLFKTGL